MYNPEQWDDVVLCCSLWIQPGDATLLTVAVLASCAPAGSHDVGSWNFHGRPGAMEFLNVCAQLTQLGHKYFINSRHLKPLTEPKCKKAKRCHIDFFLPIYLKRNNIKITKEQQKSTLYCLKHCLCSNNSAQPTCNATTFLIRTASCVLLEAVVEWMI